MRVFTKQTKTTNSPPCRVAKSRTAAIVAARSTLPPPPRTELTRFAHDLSLVPVRERLRPVAQAKGAAVSSPGDAYEREADRISESVARADAPASNLSERSGGESGALQTARVAHDDAPLSRAPHAAREVLSSHGQRLDTSARAHLEPRFGHDFSEVRVHTDSRAAESAKALNAHAYTFGNHIVFDSGRYAPASPEGRRLLAHELTHVVQQSGGHTSRGAGEAGQVISSAPAGLLSRQPKPAGDDASKKEEARKKDEAQRLDRIKFHVEQQRRVAGYLDNARKINPDAKRGTSDPDNLVHNSVQMLDSGKLTLTVLTPTHYNPQLLFDSRYKFDSKGTFPKFGGEYPPDRKSNVGMEFHEDVNMGGEVKIQPPPTPIKTDTVQKTDDRSPAAPDPTPTATAPAKPPAKSPASPPAAPVAPAPPVPFSPGDVALYTQGFPVGEDDFRQTFVHEVQHVADLSPKTTRLKNVDEVLDAYKREFRAFWIQPQLPFRAGGLAPPAINMLPAPSVKADNTTPVTINNSAVCTLCPPPPPGATGKAAFSKPTTNMKNARQEQIFQHLLSKYTSAGFDCCYVFNEQFHNEVDRYAQPEGLNVINSDRLTDLNLELRNLNPAMKRDEVSKTKVVSYLQALDALDWAFLNNPKVSAPFWDALGKSAPKSLANFVKRLAKLAAKRPLSPADFAGWLETPSQKKP